MELATYDISLHVVAMYVTTNRACIPTWNVDIIILSYINTPYQIIRVWIQNSGHTKGWPTASFLQCRYSRCMVSPDSLISEHIKQLNIKVGMQA